MLRPIPGPWRPPFRPRYVTTIDGVTYTATCDQGPHDATWYKLADDRRRTCMCTCQEGAA